MQCRNHEHINENNMNKKNCREWWYKWIVRIQQIVVDCSKLIKLQISENKYALFSYISQKKKCCILIWQIFIILYVFIFRSLYYINKIIERMLSHDSMRMKYVYQLIYNEIIFLISSKNLYLHKKKEKERKKPYTYVLGTYRINSDRKIVTYMT